MRSSERDNPEHEQTRKRLEERLEREHPGSAKTIIPLLDDLTTDWRTSFTKFLRDFRLNRHYDDTRIQRSNVLGNRKGPPKDPEKELQTRVRYFITAQVAFILHTFHVELTTTNYDDGGVFETAVKYVIEAVEGETEDDRSGAFNRYVRETVNLFGSYKERPDLLIRTLLGIRGPAGDAG